jgi:hypothetical protein
MQAEYRIVVVTDDHPIAAPTIGPFPASLHNMANQRREVFLSTAPMVKSPGARDPSQWNERNQRFVQPDDDRRLRGNTPK